MLGALQRLQPVEQPHQLHRRQAELGLLAAALGPAPRPLARELDPHAERRLDPHLVGHLEQHVELVELLDHDEHLVAQLLAHQGQAHELLVLVAVADDQVLAALAEAQHRLQLRLAAALEPHAVRVAELDDLLHHVALLVDLDRVDRGVASLVPELLDGLRERPARVAMRDRRMSEKRSSSGRPTPCASRSMASW